MRLKVLYLTSNPYSGSTVVTMRLAMQKAIASVGEISGPDPRIAAEMHQCSCGCQTANCPFWQEMLHRTKALGRRADILAFDKNWRLFSSRIAHRLMTRPAPLTGLVRLQKGLVGKVLRRSGRERRIWETTLTMAQAATAYYNADIFLDSSKDIDRILYYAATPGIDLYVLHLVRDGRGQLASAMKRGGDVQALSQKIARFDRDVLRATALLTPDRYMRLRYEDFCMDPDLAIADITAFCKLRVDSLGDKRSVSDLHVLGNPSRFRFQGKLHLDKALWADTLSPDDLRAFEALCGDRNSAYGYPA